MQARPRTRPLQASVFATLVVLTTLTAGCASTPASKREEVFPSRGSSSSRVILTVTSPKRVEGTMTGSARGDARLTVGRIELGVLVSETGRLDSVFVLAPLHPHLDSLALASVRTWTFEPGIRNGVPTAMWTPLSVFVSPPDDALRATDGEDLVALARTAAALPDFSPRRGRVVVYDTLDTRRCRVLIPPGVARAASPDTSGGAPGATWAVVRARVSADGRVADAQTLRATGAAYGRAAADAVRGWQVEPAFCDGVPTAADLVVRVPYTGR